MRISLITGGKDPHYAIGLLSGLCNYPLDIEFLCNSEMDFSRVPNSEKVVPFYLYNDFFPKNSLFSKAINILFTYIKLIIYAAKTKSTIFHIQWENKFPLFDWTLLNIYYKILGKKIIFTAHNVNAGLRDRNDNWLNRVILLFLYKITDHIIVHTQNMYEFLLEHYKISRNKITVVPFGINNVVPETALTKLQARNVLNLSEKDKVILFFGNIAPYKGLEYLVKALTIALTYDKNIRIIIAGRIKKDCFDYWKSIQKHIKVNALDTYILRKLQFIDDSEIEIYFKAADVMALPYVYIFQSGVLFMSYKFGLPVIATDVGSLREDVVDGKTGLVCEPQNETELSETILKFFSSPMYSEGERVKQKIKTYAKYKYSWVKIGHDTINVYKNME